MNNSFFYFLLAVASRVLVDALFCQNYSGLRGRFCFFLQSKRSCGLIDFSVYNVHEIYNSLHALLS